MKLADPLVICRELLLASPEVTDKVADRVYATPILPPGHTYPLIRLTHIGASDHAPVGFRQSLKAGLQLDVWSTSMSECSEVAEAALDTLHGTPHNAAGALSIRPTFEAREVDEAAQPPLYRYRADLTVLVARTA